MYSVLSRTAISNHGCHLPFFLRFNMIALIAVSQTAAKLQSDASEKVGTDVIEGIKVS